MESNKTEREETELVNGRVIIDIEGEGVLLIKRKAGFLTGKWELPGGKLYGENIREELAREVKEEVGLEIDPKALTEALFYSVVDSRKKASFFDKKDPEIAEHLFLIQLTKGDVPNIWIGEEHSTYLLITEDNLREGGFEGQLTDLAKVALKVYFYDIKKRISSGEPLLVEGPLWNLPDKK